MIWNTMLLMILIGLMLTTILTLIALIVMKQAKTTKNKLTPFECGFNPMSPLQMNFSIQFFLITILFLIFDIEIILILPFPIISLKSTIPFLSIVPTMIILILGLILEWKNGSLEWI